MAMNMSTFGEIEMNGRGTTGNVIAAIASFLYPGLGQLCQGRILSAAIFFFAATMLWFVLLGWIMHIWATLDAARYRSPYWA
jgi:TM2 domain-containing membrane protein YozV